MITTKRGLLYRDGVQLDAIEADKVAREAGHVCAENLVRHLEDEDYKKILAARKQEVPCFLCGTPTPMTGTKRCDRCWELEKRIKADPVLAERILKSFKIGRNADLHNDNE